MHKIITMNTIVVVLYDITYKTPISFYLEHYHNIPNIMFNLMNFRYKIKSRKDYVEYIATESINTEIEWYVDINREINPKMPRRIGDILVSQDKRVIINMRLFATYPDCVCIGKISVRDAQYIGSLDSIFTGSIGQFRNNDMIV